jgi:hypothetical protein
MQFTLRQAHKIVEKLNAALSDVSVDATAALSVWEVPETEQEVAALLDVLRNKLSQQIQRRGLLATVRYEIREQISVANRETVDELVAQRKLALDIAAQLRAIASAAAGRSHNDLSPAAIVAQARASRSSGQIGYLSGTVTVKLLDAETVATTEKAIKEAQLNIESIEEQLTAANSDLNNMIRLSDDVVEILRNEGIVA